MFPQRLEIATRSIGPGERAFVIAEAGVNHNGDLGKALELVDVAVEAQADAVKFQTFKAIRLVTATAPKAEYQKQNTGTAESQREMLQRLELSAADHRTLLEHCQRREIQFLSTPFDTESADLLAEMNVSAFKIGSGDLTNTPLLQHVGRIGKPVIVSTGMCHIGEVAEAVRALEEVHAPFAMLHCVSNYPAAPAESNLRAMATMSAAFGVPVGYSDHTEGAAVCLAAVALGACIIEKHITLDRSLPGPDHAASMEPDDFAALVRDIRTVETSLGDGRKRPSDAELMTATVARKSLVAATNIPAGVQLTEDLVAIKRPGTGLPPAMLAHILNRHTRSEISEGDLIQLENVA